VSRDKFSLHWTEGRQVSARRIERLGKTGDADNVEAGPDYIANHRDRGVAILGSSLSGGFLSEQNVRLVSEIIPWLQDASAHFNLPLPMLNP